MIFNKYIPNRSAQTGCNIFKESLTDLNSEFSFFASQKLYKD